MIGVSVTRRGRHLPRSFYERDPLDVAPELLNKVIESRVGGRTVRARLVEVEAYRGRHDPGAHSYRGETPRNRSMFGPPGRLYVYFIYGMHWCANVVCEQPGVGHAVLLRGAAPVSGLETLRARRRAARSDRELCSGPARLAEALAITGTLDGADLLAGPVRLLDDDVAPPARPGVSRRIGLRRGAEHPWRFYVEGDPNVSR